MTTAPQPRSTLRAVLTDVQFWVPALVLTAGIVLLVALH
ncbi:MAG TPA: translocated intimin receptor Tir [Acidobacteriaceae bacterium]|jgi:hypothetical protein